MAARYIVHGTDASSKPVQKLIEADSAAQAQQMAERLGVAVVGVEVDPGSAGSGPGDAGRDFSDDARAARRLGPETTLWAGTSSQWVNFWWYLSCLIVVTIPWAIWRYLLVKTSAYTLTSQRLRFERGVFSKTLDEVELYRVKDTQLHQTFMDRMLGIGTIEILSSDETNPRLYIPKIPQAATVREQLRQGVERLRLARGVRELDLAVENQPNH